MTATSAATIAAKRLLARSVAESVAAGKAGRNSETPRMSTVINVGLYEPIDVKAVYLAGA